METLTRGNSAPLCGGNGSLDEPAFLLPRFADHVKRGRAENRGEQYLGLITRDIAMLKHQERYFSTVETYICYKLFKRLAEREGRYA